MGNNISLEIIQNCEFGILKYIKSVCDKNGLKYFLAYGTLIGAVRHHGFIPWDDDIDIHMPREDYLKFLDIIDKDPHPYYRLISRETSPRFSHILSKMVDTRTKLTQRTYWSEKVPLGLYVDIFILDGAGNTRAEAESVYREAHNLYTHWQNACTILFPPNKSRRKSLKKWIRNLPDKVRGVRYWMDKHTEFCSQHPYYQSEFVSATGAGSRNPDRNIWERSCFGEGIEMPFCGELFRVPANWDAVLRPEYGDYTVLPPPEKRRSTHRYDLEIPDPAVLNAFTTIPTRP